MFSFPNMTVIVTDTSKIEAKTEESAPTTEESHVEKEEATSVSSPFGTVLASSDVADYDRLSQRRNLSLERRSSKVSQSAKMSRRP